MNHERKIKALPRAMDEIDQFIHDNRGDNNATADAIEAAGTLRRTLEIAVEMFDAADNDQRRVFNLRWRQLRKAVSNG